MMSLRGALLDEHVESAVLLDEHPMCTRTGEVKGGGALRLIAVIVAIGGHA